MLDEDRAEHDRDRRVVARVDLHRLQRVERRHSAAVLPHVVLDVAHDLLGLALAAVDRQPARALGNVGAQEDDADRQDRADEEHGAPAVLRRDDLRIEEHQRGHRADRAADPERAVDGKIGSAAEARRNELLDRRVHRGIFTADARPGQAAEQRVGEEVPGEGGRRGGDEVETQRHEEQLAPPEPVGRPAEDQRAHDRAGEVEAVADADLRVGEVQRLVVLQRARDQPGEGHLETVEDPGDAEGGDHQRVEPPPTQRVEPRRDAGLDRLLLDRSRHSPAPRFPACCRMNTDASTPQFACECRLSGQVRSQMEKDGH